MYCRNRAGWQENSLFEFRYKAICSQVLNFTREHKCQNGAIDDFTNVVVDRNFNIQFVETKANERLQKLLVKTAIIVAKEQACQFLEATKCSGMYKGFVKMQEKLEYHFV